ncbi:MAG: hypothetical protein AAF870_01365 [Pseudomonadota bacterium]
MTKRSQRGYIKKEQVLKKLQTGRQGAIQVHAEAKINSDEYRAATVVAGAIDDLAEQLTGDETFFHLKPHSSGN